MDRIVRSMACRWEAADRRSCCASFRIPTLPAYCLTTCHTTFSVISAPLQSLQSGLSVLGFALHEGRALVSATVLGASWNIQFLLGHVSVQTTEKYLGCKQRLREAVNDRLGIEPTPDLVYDPLPPDGAL